MKKFLTGMLFTGLLAVSIPAFAACPCPTCCPTVCPACPCPTCDPCEGMYTFQPGENLRVAKVEFVTDPCNCATKKIIKVFKIKPACPCCPCDPCA